MTPKQASYLLQIHNDIHNLVSFFWIIVTISFIMILLGLVLGRDW